MSEPVVAIVVAAGSGVRLGAGAPKALREIRGVPLVTRSVRALARGGVDAFVIVIAADLADDFAAALAGVTVPWQLVPGGAERQDSVRHGLVAVSGDPELAGCRIVLVHDAARAFVPAEVVGRVIDAVRGGARSVVPVIPVVDTVRTVDPAGSSIVDRSNLRAVQTPQGFDLATLLQAHELLVEEGAVVTDDAAACERLGVPTVLVNGSREAFKVTEPLDLVFAEALARQEEL